MRGVIAVLAVIAAMGGVTQGAAGAEPGSLVPANELVAGKTYAQWLKAAWQWQLAHGHLRMDAPKQNQTLACLPQAASGKVFFLQDTYEGPTPVTVSCRIPAGRYLYLEGPGFECSTIEPAPYRARRSNLTRCASSFRLKGEDVSVDGQPISPCYSVATPVFRFSVPAKGNVVRAKGHTRGYGAAHADAVVLRPLTPGTHTIVQVEHFASGKFAQTTWQLTVG